MRRSAARRNLLILAATLLSLRSTWFSTTAVIPQVRQEWSLSASAASWLTIPVQWGFVLGAWCPRCSSSPTCSPRPG